MPSARTTFAHLNARFAMLMAALMLAMLVAAPAASQENTIRATLLAEGAVAPGGETTLALRFTPVSEEWHGYWANPGDAGLPMELEWAAPAGVTIGEALYPTPQRLVIDGLMNHIFEGEYAVLLPLRLAKNYAGDDVIKLKLALTYLACTDRICVPQQEQLQAAVPVGEDGGPNAAFTRYRSQLAPLIDAPGRYAIAGNLLRLAIPVAAGVEVGEPHIFIRNRQLVDYAARQGFRRKGDWLVGEIPLAENVTRPDRLEGIVRLGNGRGLRFEAEPGAIPSGGKRLMALADERPALWVLLAGALVGGLLLNIMPCVFPILSLKALSLARAGGGEGEARAEGLAYTAGVVLACVALGGAMLGLRAAGEQVGWAFQLQEPGVVVALLALAVLITANLLGAFELPGLAISGGSTPRGAFSTGLLAAFVATPCTGPFMAAALGAALLLPAGLALVLFAALGLGLALPFLLLGFIPALRNRLPKPGPWMATFRKLLAIPMGLTALALVWLVWRIGGAGFALLALAVAALLCLAAVFAWARRQKLQGGVVALGAILLATGGLVNFEPQERQLQAQVLNSVPFSKAALEQARASGVPVFVYFTADWCVSCKVNERVAIERAATRDAFAQAGIVTLRGDWTLREPEITEFLNQRGVAGVPLYLWYSPLAAEPEQLPQLLAPDSLIRLARDSDRPDRVRQ
ncbi:MAG: thiol:disulfide interchange protein [Sphingomonadaceae bacterium]|nr:MAG: thiol:disulfide interchange protein [Sphingomonadaceae bacterium]